MRTERLTVLEKIGFGSGDAAVNVVWSAVTIILMYFYTDVYALNPAHIAWLMLVPRLIDAFTDVFMGMYTDSHTTRWGRYRPYLVIFAVPFGLAVMLMFTTPNFSYTGKLIYAYATYILMILIFTAVTIPYISLPGVLTADPKERLSANGYRLFFAKVASLMVNIFVPIFAGYYASKHGETELPRGYQIAMAVMAVLSTALFIFCFFTTTERVKHKSDRKPIGRQLGLLLRNSQWTILAVVCLIGTIGYVLRGSVALYYAQYFLGGGGKMQGYFVATGIVGNILAMVASTWITKKYCKIQLYRWTQVLTFVVSVLMYLVVKPGDVAAAFVFYFLINFIVDLQGPVFWSIISEAVDYGQVKSGKRVSGMAFGGISWCQKMGMSLAGGMGGMLLVFFKYLEPIDGVAQVQSAFTLKGFSLMLSVIPGAFHLIVGLLMFKYFITDKYYNENVRELVTHEVINNDE
jgi:GPH family glycoside/pentoside/hexuronide:cation symporter